MPEGDSVHRSARRLQPLVGQRIAAISPHPRARVTRVAERVDGHVLESVEAIGKNLFFHFDGGVVLRSHLRLSGRWARGGHQVYRHVGRLCSRCGGRIRSRGQGDDNRMIYWCPSCQAGEEPCHV